MKLFEKINQQGTIWVKDMMVALPTSDEHKALQALRAGLQALRDRMTVREVAQLSAQLPLLVRGMFFEGWDPADKPLRIRHLDEFLSLIRDKYAQRADLAARDVLMATFRVLSKHVSTGELTQILFSLPKELLDAATGAHEEHDL